MARNEASVGSASGASPLPKIWLMVMFCAATVPAIWSVKTSVRKAKPRASPVAASPSNRSASASGLPTGMASAVALSASRGNTNAVSANVTPSLIRIGTPRSPSPGTRRSAAPMRVTTAAARST